MDWDTLFLFRDLVMILGSGQQFSERDVQLVLRRGRCKRFGVNRLELGSFTKLL